MKRFFIVLLVFLLLVSLKGVRAYGVDEEDIYKASGAAEPEAGGEDKLWDSLWSSLTGALKGALPKAFKYGALIIACLLLISVLNGIRGIQNADISGSAMQFVSAAALV